MTPAPRQVVIVGASLAGLTAARTLREEGHTGPITLVGSEPHAPYDRPPLSKEFLRPGTPRHSVALDRTDSLGLNELYGTGAAGLDLVRRNVCLEDGRRLDFDGLVIATGVRPRTWAGDLPLSGVHTVRTIDDAEALRHDLDRGPRDVVVIGGGFIGSETAATAHELGHRVTLVGTGPAPLYAVIGAAAAEFVAQLHVDAGVALLAGRATSLHGTADVTGVTIDSGARLPADVVVLALGDRANTEWLNDSGLLLGRGVITDENTRAIDRDGRPLAHIVAAGDVTRFPHPDAGGLLSLGHWSNAIEQARVAARTLLHPERPTPYRPVPSFWSTQYGVMLRSVGLPGQADRHEVHELDLERRRLDVTYWRGDQLVGALTANRAGRIATYRAQLATLVVVNDAGAQLDLIPRSATEGTQVSGPLR